MRIQCDVCGKGEASAFCTADDAALCSRCDHRVHHANKLASKHQRFSLLTPSSKDSPLCDICQVRRAFLFCQQDRAILCRECDVPIHAANEHTQKHDRFLLTGVKLSATSALYVSDGTSGSSSDGCGFQDIQSEGFVPATETSPCSLVPGNSNNICFIAGVAAAEVSVNSQVVVGKDGNGSGTNGSTSSISEYLIETLPGWHFEDFLESCPASFGFSKNYGGGHPQLIENDIDCEISSFSSESFGIWVPTLQTPPHPSQFTNPSPQPNPKITKTPKRWNNDSFAVPEIRTTSPSSTTEFKRSRKF